MIEPDTDPSSPVLSADALPLMPPDIVIVLSSAEKPEPLPESGTLPESSPLSSVVGATVGGDVGADVTADVSVDVATVAVDVATDVATDVGCSSVLS